MRWLLKSAVQNLFGVVPNGHHLNRVLQRNLTSRLIPGHVQHLEKIHRVLADETHIAVEIGTGWCPTIPLGLTSKGIHVHTFDRTRHVTVDTLAASQAAVGGDWGMVHYHAPGDATATGLPDGSVDLHFSIAVLEHVPREIIPLFFQEARRILRIGGILYHEIDLRDHFAEFDPSISSVNFLRFNDFTWKLLGQNKIHFHNRLRASDFTIILEQFGFEIVNLETRSDERGVAALKSMHIADRFKPYEDSDLATSVLTVTAKKR